MSRMRATGPFEVKLAPQQDGDNPIGRLTIDKRYSGDLDATSIGQMLAFSSAVKGSAGYVAMERVSGALHGKRGSFVLQHVGTMDRGDAGLTITVVADSGTDELTGLTGTMMIHVVEKQHSYEFEYEVLVRS